MTEEKGNKGFGSILMGGFLAEPKTARHIPFVLFIVFLALVSIWSAHQADSKVHKIAKLKKEMKESKSAFISTRSELMQKSRASEVEKRVESLGLQLPTEAAIKIENK